MLKSVYKESEKSVEEQILDIIKNDNAKDGMYDMKLKILTNIPIDTEHVCDIPVLIYRHPNNYYYIYMCKGSYVGKHGLLHSPCGLIKANPYRRGGPMFFKEWISELNNKNLNK